MPGLKLEDLILFNADWVYIKSSDFFPDFLFIYKQILQGNELFCPEPPCNERNFFNKLRGWGKKMNKKKNKKILYLYNF